jgi:catalase
MPTPRKPDQSAPAPTSPTGTVEGDPATGDARAQVGEFLTTAQGLRLPDTDHSLKVGTRGPTLLEDFHLREKITHFDHERIPERVVHARGAAAHGVFEAYGTASSVTKAGTSFTPPSLSRTARSRRHSPLTTPSGTSYPCTPRPPTASCGT